LTGYVNLPDLSYAWNDTSVRFNGNVDGVAWTGYVLSMTSLTWLSHMDIVNPTWKHTLVLIVPSSLEAEGSAASRWCSLYVAWHSPFDAASLTAEDAAVRTTAHIAVHTGALAAVLFDVPPRSVTFTADPTKEERREDSLEAYSWTLFKNDTTRPETIVELPNTKAVVRAMDTVQAFANEHCPLARRSVSPSLALASAGRSLGSPPLLTPE